MGLGNAGGKGYGWQAELGSRGCERRVAGGIGAPERS